SADDVLNGYLHNSFDLTSLRTQLAQMSFTEQLDFYWQEIECANADLQPDIYYLNVAGLNVKFFINREGAVVQINKTDAKIVPLFEGSVANDLFGTLKSFIVTGSDG